MDFLTAEHSTCVRLVLACNNSEFRTAGVFMEYVALISLPIPLTIKKRQLLMEPQCRHPHPLLNTVTVPI
jgi:hypothetical protein